MTYIEHRTKISNNLGMCIAFSFPKILEINLFSIMSDLPACMYLHIIFATIELEFGLSMTHHVNAKDQS